jgi:23S rRNA (uridine2552-2'-O)-methyltransferase
MTNSNKRFFDKKRNESYYKKKIELKVRARSYFKLENIDKKFNFINPNMSIIDLGCAPGAWLEYINNKLKDKKFDLIGIDLLEVRNQFQFKNTKVIYDDFNNILDHINEDKKFDLVLSDLAQEFSGNDITDRGRCHKLNVETLNFSKVHLRKGKNLVFKSFYGKDYDGSVLPLAKVMFNRIVELKPLSSQKKSSEFYVICLEKK